MQQKEYIKSRMLKEIASIWDVKGTISQESFDPLVNMLISALASESELIYDEIDQTQERVARKLLNKLVPQVNGGAQPGHTMAMLTPVEEQFLLPKNSQLRSQVRLDAGNLKTIYFSTANDVQLFKGGVKYQLIKDSHHQIVEGRYKTPVVDLPSELKEPGDKQLSLVIENNSGKELNGLSLFFDLPQAYPQRKVFWNLLKRASFSVNGQAIDSPFKQSSSFSIRDEDSLSEIEQQIDSYYQLQYINLKWPKGLLDTSNELLEVCVDFSQILPLNIGDELMVYTNVVPVVNLQLHKKIFKRGVNTSIFSLDNDALFYSINNVSSDGGKVYQAYNSAASQINKNDGVYIVRNEEVAGFSKDSANELVNYLIGKLRNENAAFTGVSKGNFANDLKLLNQITKRLEQTVSVNKSNKKPVYILIENEEVDDYLFVEYYTTDGELLKNLKVNSPLYLVSGSALDQNGNCTIAPVVGARDCLNEEEQYVHVRHSIYAGGKIVSSKDVSSLIQMLFGSKLKSVEVVKGMCPNEDLKNGYERTIDVNVETQSSENENELLTMGRQALITLEENGSNIFPYRVFVNKNLVQR